jgi:large subunit ribosomal protein L6
LQGLVERGGKEVSRIGRLPINIPKGVEIKVDGSYVHVKGPKGSLEWTFNPEIGIKMDEGQLIIERPNDEPRMRALHGTTRALLNNMVVGVSTGFERVLDIIGVGYRAEMDGKNMIVNVGYSHPVKVEAPEGISFEVDMRTRRIIVRGYDKQQVGQVAANIRKIRPPEPYKGTGIKYAEEIVRRKAGKAGKTA